MYYVYILISTHYGKYYVGCTNNLNERLKKHNSGKVFWTKIYKPWNIIYTEQYNRLDQARKREHQIKCWKKRKSIEKLIESSTY